VERRVQHHDGERQDVGAIFVLEHTPGTLVLLKVFHGKHLHDLVNLLGLSLGGGREQTHKHTIEGVGVTQHVHIYRLRGVMVEWILLEMIMNLFINVWRYIVYGGEIFSEVFVLGYHKVSKLPLKVLSKKRDPVQ